MFLMQRGDQIEIGTKERLHKLSVSRFGHFTRDDANAACDDLLAAHPEEAEQVERYRARLLGMV